MKKSILAISLFFAMSLPTAAMAAPPPPPLVPVQESAPENERESLLRELGLEQEDETALPAPVAVEQRNIDGTEYIIKVFETAEDVAPEKLADEDFEQDGFLFRHLTTDRKSVV